MYSNVVNVLLTPFPQYDFPRAPIVENTSYRNTRLSGSTDSRYGSNGSLISLVLNPQSVSTARERSGSRRSMDALLNARQRRGEIDNSHFHAVRTLFSDSEVAVAVASSVHQSVRTIYLGSLFRWRRRCLSQIHPEKGSRRRATRRLR